MKYRVVDTFLDVFLIFDIFCFTENKNNKVNRKKMRHYHTRLKLYQTLKSSYNYFVNSLYVIFCCKFFVMSSVPKILFNIILKN